MKLMLGSTFWWRAPLTVATSLRSAAPLPERKAVSKRPRNISQGQGRTLPPARYDQDDASGALLEAESPPSQALPKASIRPRSRSPSTPERQARGRASGPPSVARYAKAPIRSDRSSSGATAGTRRPGSPLLSPAAATPPNLYDARTYPSAASPPSALRPARPTAYCRPRIGPGSEPAPNTSSAEREALSARPAGPNHSQGTEPP